MTGPARNLLFVCSLNQRRSVTAESLFAGLPGYDVLSAGTEPGARVRVTEAHIRWADMVFAMDEMHVSRLRSQFKAALKGKRLICLQIPDRYGCMSLELTRLLKEKLGLYLDVPG